MPIVFIVLATCLSAGSVAAGDYIWWEGETPIDTNFPRQTSYSPRPGEDRHLSAGNWLTNINKNETGEDAFAVYRISVRQAGQYKFWTRKFWKHGPFRWRFDEQDWRECGRDVSLADQVDLRTHVCANWVYLGDVELAAGQHTFELRLLAGKGENLTACFDAFVLTDGPFMPNGKWKPDERSQLAEDGFFAYEPGLDAFSADALLDLRGLNEEQAGQSGFVRRNGGQFELGDGTPVRFWAVGVGSNRAGQDRDAVDYLARRLAKLGVNMVRYHSPMFDNSEEPGNIHQRKLDNLCYMIASMKQQGIYTKLSFYFPSWFKVRPRYGLPGYERQKNKLPFVLLYFEPRMQAIYRQWAKQILTAENPYTGVRLADEPALAIVEIINEDSFFFWTFKKSNVPPRYWQQLEGMFGQWLRRRYGSLDRARRAWGGTKHRDDAPGEGRMALYEAWSMTGEVLKKGAVNRKRIGDQVRFLTELQRDFYQQTVRYFKEELGYKGLVSASNWKVSDPAMLDALERYTYTAGDMIDRHGYFGGPHKGEGAAYSVRVGHTYEDLAAVKAPAQLPIQTMQVADYPQIISELGWTNPNRFRADATLLAGAYGRLQGVDGLFFFAAGSNFVRDAAMYKFAATSPVIAATFPAAALAYRRGDVTEAPPAVHQVLKLADLYAMKGSGAFAAEALDAFRRADVPESNKLRGAVKAFDPLSFYVGRIERTFSGDPSTSQQVDLPKYIDRDAGTIRSLTGELVWNYDHGLVTVDSPRCQAAAGFLGAAGTVKLTDSWIKCGNEYGAVWIIALDDRPLAESQRILIQAMTEEKPYGFQAEGGRITNMGGPPFNVRRIRAAVGLQFASEAAHVRVTALDENGYATDKPITTRGDGVDKPLMIHLADDAIYHVVERGPVPANAGR